MLLLLAVGVVLDCLLLSIADWCFFFVLLLLLVGRDGVCCCCLKKDNSDRDSDGVCNYSADNSNNGNHGNSC